MKARALFMVKMNSPSLGSYDFENQNPDNQLACRVMKIGQYKQLFVLESMNCIVRINRALSWWGGAKKMVWIKEKANTRK